MTSGITSSSQKGIMAIINRTKSNEKRKFLEEPALPLTSVRQMVHGKREEQRVLEKVHERLNQNSSPLFVTTKELKKQIKIME